MTAQTQNAQISIGEAMEILNIRGRQTLYNLIDREGLTVTRSKIGRGRGGQRVFLQRAEIEKLRDADAAARASASERAALAALAQKEKDSAALIATLPQRERAALETLAQKERDASAKAAKPKRAKRSKRATAAKPAPTK